MNDDELIITNEQEQPAETPTQPVVLSEDETMAKTMDKPKDEPVTKQVEKEDSFSKILHDQILEEDAAPQQGITVIKILGGDFFATQILRRQIGIILVLVAFSLVYISNRYSCQNSLLEIDKLKKELQDAKYKALSTSSKLTEQSRQSIVLEKLKTCKDSVLRISDQPPYVINIQETDG